MLEKCMLSIQHKGGGKMSEEQSKCKLAIFDLDGTLFDTRKANYCAYRDALNQFGFQIEYDYYCSYCNGRYFKDFLPQISTEDERILNEIHLLKKARYSEYLDQIRPNKALLDIVKLLRAEYYTAIVTSASSQNCNQLLEYFSVTNYFDKVITHDDIKYKKPDPEGFLMAMTYFNVDSSNTIIFEDSDIGIKAAEKSGANCYVVKGYN